MEIKITLHLSLPLNASGSHILLQNKHLFLGKGNTRPLLLGTLRGGAATATLSTSLALPACLLQTLLTEWWWYYEKGLNQNSGTTRSLSVLLLLTFSTFVVVIDEDWQNKDELLPRNCRFHLYNWLLSFFLVYFDFIAKQRFVYEDISNFGGSCLQRTVLLQRKPQQDSLSTSLRAGYHVWGFAKVQLCRLYCDIMLVLHVFVMAVLCAR